MRGLLTILAMVLPSVALAQAASGVEAASTNSQLASFAPLLFIFGIFYILLIRPQQKRLKQHQVMLTQLVKGDEVVTAGGIVGKVTKAEEGETITVEIAKGVEVSVVKNTISTVLGKTAVKPATPEKKKGANKNDNSLVNKENIANDN